MTAIAVHCQPVWQMATNLNQQHCCHCITHIHSIERADWSPVHMNCDVTIGTSVINNLAMLPIIHSAATYDVYEKTIDLKKRCKRDERHANLKRRTKKTNHVNFFFINTLFFFYVRVPKYTYTHITMSKSSRNVIFHLTYCMEPILPGGYLWQVYDPYFFPFWAVIGCQTHWI